MGHVVNKNRTNGPHFLLTALVAHGGMVSGLWRCAETLMMGPDCLHLRASAHPVNRCETQDSLAARVPKSL